MINVNANASIGFGLAAKLPNVPIIAKEMIYMMSRKRCNEIPLGI